MSNFWKELKRPFFSLAPMEDVTDFVFREIVAEHLPKPDVFFTEFTSADALCSDGRQNALDKLKYSEGERPIVAQIWGVDTDNLYKAAKLVQKLGFDGVDINMGCPDRNVMKKGAGAALCANPQLAGEIIDAVKAGANKIPVSVKTRLGYKKMITEEWARFLLGKNIQALAIHGRIAKQRSFGDANWDEIGKAVKIRDEMGIDTLIVGNGDILSTKQGKDVANKYNLDGIMIGRGIFHNPWVFDPTSPESYVRGKEEYIDLMMKHVDLYVDTWGDTKNFEIMKKFFKMYVRSFDGAAQFRDRLMQTKTPEEVKEIAYDIKH